MHGVLVFGGGQGQGLCLWTPLEGAPPDLQLFKGKSASPEGHPLVGVEGAKPPPYPTSEQQSRRESAVAVAQVPEALVGGD